MARLTDVQLTVTKRDYWHRSFAHTQGVECPFCAYPMDATVDELKRLGFRVTRSGANYLYVESDGRMVWSGGRLVDAVQNGLWRVISGRAPT